MLLSISLSILGAMLAYTSVKHGNGKMAFIGSMTCVLGVAL